MKNYDARRTLTVVAMLALLLLAAGPGRATELVYQPVNPSFGGNPLNGTFLLNQAQLQNDFDKKSSGASGFSSGWKSASPLDTFQSQLVQRVLSGLADKIVASSLGTSTGTDLSTGNFQFGDYAISVNNTGQVIQVTIQNQLTGESTHVEVPVLK
jgi:curli production assembly/transport component CsgF